MTAAKGFVLPAGGGKHFPGRFFAMKLLGRETGESIMMFEETLPAGTTSRYHLPHDSDEVAWVLEGEFTFKIGDEVSAGGPGTWAFMPRDVPRPWKNTGSETDRGRRADRDALRGTPEQRGRASQTLRAPSLGGCRPQSAVGRADKRSSLRDTRDLPP
jgi:quercetin dioxygenase-like cupin family protein